MTRVVRVLLLLLILVGVAGGLSRARVQTDLHAFLPAADASVDQYDRLAREYGGDPIAILVESKEDRALLGEQALPALVRMEGELAGQEGVSAVYGPGTMLNQIAGQTQDLLAELAGRRDAEIQRARAEAELQGSSGAQVKAAGLAARDRFDTRYGPLVVQGLPGGAPTLKNSRFVQRVLFDDAGLVRSQWRFLVPGPRAMAVLVRPDDGLDAAQTAALVDRVRRVVADRAPKAAHVSIAGAPVLVGAMADTVSHDVPRLGLIAVGLVALALGAATWVRRSRRWAPLAVTLVSMVGTVSVLGWLDRPLSLGVVGFGTVLLGIGCYYPSYVTVRASARTVLVVAVATAASLATLVLSPIPLVQDLGLALAVGVLLAASLSTLVRGWLVEGLEPVDTAPVARRSAPWAKPLLAAGILAAALGWLHLGDLDVRADVAEFAGGLPSYTAAEHIADVLGSSGELDVALRGPDVTTPEALQWQRQTQDAVVSSDGDRVRLILSAPSMLRFLGSSATAGQIQAVLRLLPPYLTQAAIAPDRSSALISFGVRLEELGSLRPVVASLEDVTAPAGYRAEVVGLPVVALRAEELLKDDLLLANGAAIGVSALVLALGLRRRSDALRALVAGAIATGLGFLLLWATGTALNPVTAALGALTAAAGCEFTVVQAEARRSRSTRLRRAVLIGVATSVTGYLVLISSDLHAVRSLGVTLSIATLLALAASWLVVRASATPATEEAADA